MSLSGCCLSGIKGGERLNGENHKDGAKITGFFPKKSRMFLVKLLKTFQDIAQIGKSCLFYHKEY